MAAHWSSHVLRLSAYVSRVTLPSIPSTDEITKAVPHQGAARLSSAKVECDVVAVAIALPTQLT
jgi:hypothetical protein